MVWKWTCTGTSDKIPVAEKDFMFSAITEEFGANLQLHCCLYVLIILY